MPAQTLGREQRLRRQSDFQALRERGISRAHPLLVLRAAPNGLPYARFGFIVSRRVALRAVVRNRTRRRMREIARRTPVHTGWDLLFIARRAVVQARFADLRDAMRDVEQRAGVLDQGEMPEPRAPESGTVEPGATRPISQGREG